MITKDCSAEDACVLYASEYHLEMILLPYLKEEINKSKIIILTEKDLEKSLTTLLTKINLKKDEKEKIKNINWKADDYKKIQDLKKCIEKKEKVKIIINGKKEYRKRIEEILQDYKISKIYCFNINENDININEIRQKYSIILNTKKLK